VQERFADVADEVLCLVQPRRYAAVGQVYDDFGEVSDAQVAALLRAGPGGSGR
jgi:predicted phosphoribosyltransferase